jgi:hypothetical protein
LGIGTQIVQVLLELHHLGKLEGLKNVAEIGSQELHLKKEDLNDLYLQAGLDATLTNNIPNLDNWPGQPRATLKALYNHLGIQDYTSMDINGDFGSIPLDLNYELTDKSLFDKFDIVTDFGSCEHVFNVGECYKTIHKMTKVNGLIIIYQSVFKGNGYFLFDRSFMEGIAAANNYKIITSSYVVSTGTKTSAGSDKYFHIPMSEDLIRSLKDIRSLSICMILQKTQPDDFKIPYQGTLSNQKYNSYGFNKIYNKDDLSVSYIPQYNLNNVSSRILVKEIYNRIKKRIKR